MKDRRLWILPGALLLLSSAFLLLSFRVAVSNIQALHRIMVTELEGNYPERLQPDDKISLVLVGEGPLVRALQKALVEEMDNVGIVVLKNDKLFVRWLSRQRTNAHREYLAQMV